MNDILVLRAGTLADASLALVRSGLAGVRESFLRIAGSCDVVKPVSPEGFLLDAVQHGSLPGDSRGGSS
jgi:hypothetical protein